MAVRVTAKLIIVTPDVLQAERIGLDHVARITSVTGEAETSSKVSEHLMAQHSSIKMLASRVSLVLDYIKAVEAGDLPHNHEILREAKARPVCFFCAPSRQATCASPRIAVKPGF